MGQAYLINLPSVKLTFIEYAKISIFMIKNVK